MKPRKKEVVGIMNHEMNQLWRGNDVDEAMSYDREPMNIDDVDIRDDFMFAYIIQNPEICIELLEYLLPGHKISKVQFFQVNEKQQEVPQKEPRLETQKAIAEAFNKRGVRLDAYLDDGTTIYNIEMQTTRQPMLPQRSRLYQAHLDIHQLQRGQQYDELRPSYVIFICTFDPFGKGHYRYTFRNVCQELPLELNDGTYKLFFSTVGTKGAVSDGLKEILRYINDPKHFEIDGTMPRLIERIDQAVNEAKMSDEWRRAYMTYQIHQRDAELRGEQRGIAIGEKRGEQRGIAIGEKRGILETSKKMLQAGITAQDVARITGLSLEEVKALINQTVN